MLNFYSTIMYLYENIVEDSILSFRHNILDFIAPYFKYYSLLSMNNAVAQCVSLFYIPFNFISLFSFFYFCTYVRS